MGSDPDQYEKGSTATSLSSALGPQGGGALTAAVRGLESPSPMRTSRQAANYWSKQLRSEVSLVTPGQLPFATNSKR